MRFGKSHWSLRGTPTEIDSPRGPVFYVAAICILLMFCESGAAVDLRVSDALQCTSFEHAGCGTPCYQVLQGIFLGCSTKAQWDSEGSGNLSFENFVQGMGGVEVASAERVQLAVSVQASRRCDSSTEVPLSRLPKWQVRFQGFL